MHADVRIELQGKPARPYLQAVEGAFGADVDSAMLVKMYGAAPESARGRYSPAECTGIRKTRIESKPDEAHVSTSHVEPQNLAMLMHMRRFTRLTNAFSRKFENHAHMVAIYTVWYNHRRPHSALGYVTPVAYAAQITATGDRLRAAETLRRSPVAPSALQDQSH